MVFDIVVAYPHSPIDQDIYIKPAEEFLLKDMTQFLHLQQALYWTQQAAMWWRKHFSIVLAVMGFECCINDQRFYVLKYKGDTDLIWIHVDNGAICASTEGVAILIRECLLNSFEVTWMDGLVQIMGIKVSRNLKAILLFQPKLTLLWLSNCGVSTSRVATRMIADLKLEREKGNTIDGTIYLLVAG